MGVAMALTPIPGLSFSWQRAWSITQAKQRIAKATGIPISKAGAEREIGSVVFKLLTGKNKHPFHTTDEKMLGAESR